AWCSCFTESCACYTFQLWMDAITLLTPNEQECIDIFGSDIRAALEAYPNRLIVTLGAEGARYFDCENHVHVPGFRADVVDTTGAGDTFNGALAYAVANGYPFREAVLFANAAGSLAVGKMGAQSGMPGLKEVCDRMRERR
ncbi:MAG TPA: PfkB family carbohydrate kinase, partial [Bacillota bacterium]|nr:PfkB family carbohydrate kinase [Bacillota bacterium]